jgi:anti-sigma B factor antagonist
VKVKQRQVDSTTIIDLEGKLTLESRDALQNAVEAALSAGARNILLNMKSVTAIDSSGVGALVGSYTTAANRGARVKLSSLSDRINDVLTITQLITVFDTYDSEAEALRSFGAE